MAKTINKREGKLDRKAITVVAAILVVVLVLGVFALYTHGKAHPSPTQAAAESQRALQKAADLVNSGQAAGPPAKTEGQPASTP